MKLPVSHRTKKVQMKAMKGFKYTPLRSRRARAWEVPSSEAHHVMKGVQPQQKKQRLKIQWLQLAKRGQRRTTTALESPQPKAHHDKEEVFVQAYSASAGLYGQVYIFSE